MCQEIRFGECPQHGPLPSLRPTVTLPGPKSYAVSTFPDEVGLCISSLPLAGYGVFARQFIPMGTWIGPYEGKKISVEEGMKQISQGDAAFLWEVGNLFGKLVIGLCFRITGKALEVEGMHFNQYICSHKNLLGNFYWNRGNRVVWLDEILIILRDILRDLVSFVQFKKREKQPPLRSITFSKVLHGCFSRFLDCAKIPNHATHHICI